MCPVCRASLTWLAPANDEDAHTPLGALLQWARRGSCRTVVRVYRNETASPVQTVGLAPEQEVRLLAGGETVGIALTASGEEAVIRWNDGETRAGRIPLVSSRAGFRVCVMRQCEPAEGGPARPVGEKGPQPIALSGIERVVRVGSAARLVGERGIHIATAELQPLHAFFAVDDDGDSHDDWIVSADPEVPVRVGRQPVIARRIETGDVVQIGPYLWQYSKANRRLVPVEPIDGVALVLKDARDRNGIVVIEEAVLGPGELIAVTGPSGCGKSTLLEMILDVRLLADAHSITAIDEASREAGSFRNSVGYVPQKNVHHDELAARDIVAFSRRIFLSQSPSDTAPDIAEVLDLVDLDSEQRRMRASSLSGGQRRRVQIATQLVRKVRLFVLDEPTSGLDAQREREVLLQLRALALRGATVLVTIHNEQSLAVFDRVIVLERGRIRSDTCPKPIPRITADGMPDAGRVAQASENGRTERSESVAGVGTTGINNERKTSTAHAAVICSACQVFVACLSREIRLIGSQFLWRVAIPLLLVPALFALAIGSAIPATQLDLLGFLTVLSVVWLSSSIAHQAISGERQIFEYDRLLSLHPDLYAAAKFVAYSLSAELQVVVLVSVLWVVRITWIADSSGTYFYHPWWVFMWLLAVSLSGVGIGLFISAACGRFRKTAGVLLPLVMLAQMVFSVELAGNGDIFVDQAYAPFSLSRPSPEAADSNHEQSRGMAETLPIFISYFTVSRYGDMALRRIAYIDPRYAEHDNDDRWKREAALGIAGMIFVSVLLTAAFLRLSQRERM